MTHSARPGGIRFALRHNSRIAYDPGAPAAVEAEAPTVMMLHALLADHGAFAAQRDALADDYRLILPDARGHGASPTLANQWYTVAELAADAIAILDAEEIESAHLVGHDLGGAIAFEVVRRYPERVRSLSLIEPALVSVLDKDPRAEAKTARVELRTNDRAAADAAYKGLADKALDGYLAPRWGRDWRAATARPRMGAIRRHAAALSGILPALDAYTVTRADARAMTLPVLILVGMDAAALDRDIATRLAEWLPNARLEQVPLGGRPNRPLGGEQGADVSTMLADFWSLRHERER